MLFVSRCRSVSARRLAACVLVLLAVALAPPKAEAIFGFEPHFRHGAVYARALVLSETGNPIYVEYGANGQLVAEIGEATGDLADKTIMAGSEFRSYTTLESEFRAANADGIAEDAILMTAPAFQAQSFVTVDGTAIPRPSLETSTRSVLVRAVAQRFLPDPGQLVLLEFPVDLTATPMLPDNVTSVLLSDDGTIHRQSEHNIGFKVGFFGEDGEQRFGRAYDDVIHGPVASVPLEIGHFVGGRSVTGEDGKYSLNYFVPPCPGFTFDYNTPIFAELHYRNFRPTGSATIPYYLYRPDSTFCNGLGAFPPSLTLGGLMAQVAVIGILASQARPNLTSDFPVGVMMLTGNSALTNFGIEGSTDVSVSDATRYTENPQTLELAARTDFDFDGDGQSDLTVLGELMQVDGEAVFQPNANGQLQGIYLSSGTRAPDAATPALRQPDFTRLADSNPYVGSRGLLESLSVDDLRDTDLYVFRKSNGKLVMEREGLAESELGNLVSSTVDEQSGRFVYRLLIRGPGDGLSFSALVRRTEFSDWQSAAKMAPELHARQSDHLRAGEEVELIAINRQSGYIGSVTTRLRGANESGIGEISFPIDEIQMGPPNLKISARRQYDIEFGATAGEDPVDYTVGFEGAGLTSDNYIEIRTEWLASDGSALPDGLGDFGYTGRLARVAGAGSLEPVGGDLAEFQIKPGIQMQVIQLQDDNLTKQHFYVHVHGDYADADFGASGAAGSGPLQFRPDNYVPVKVQLFDETSTIAQDRVYRRLRRENPNQQFAEPAPVFVDAYRPEFQFSVFDLDVTGLNRVNVDETGAETAIDILREAKPTIASSDDLISVLFSLAGAASDPLDPIDNERVLVLSVGESEQEVTVGSNQTVRFGDLSALALLDAIDFLSVRLYTNNDSSNVLWQFAFQRLGLFADMDRDGEIRVDAAPVEDRVTDTQNSADTPLLFWVNDDDDEGEINEGKGAGGDVPADDKPDHDNDVVDGMRDLVDFFAVYPDIKSALESFPISGHTYRLKHADGALNYFETTLLPTSADPAKRVDAPLNLAPVAAMYADAQVTQITADGVALSADFLRQIESEQGGVLMVEASAETTAPLELEVVDNSNQEVVNRAELAIEISPVQKMFRHINLQAAAENRGNSPEPGWQENLAEPEGLPDDRNDARYFVFVHGYNVSGQAARGWNSEIFKRFHQLGFHGRFIGVTWNGDTGADYHHAVYNAFRSSAQLGARVQAALPEPGPVTIAGHSLGNVVVSNALAFGGLDADNYYLINAASPIEAYDMDQTVGRDGATVMAHNMTEGTWRESATEFFPPELYAANWHKLFDDADNRSRLTWRDRFSSVLGRAYNFYSPGEEVVENADPGETVTLNLINRIGDFMSGRGLGAHAWVTQEIAKGCKNFILGWFVFDNCTAGWQYNRRQVDLEFVGEENPFWDPGSTSSRWRRLNDWDEATAAWQNGDLTREELAQFGFFRQFEHWDDGEAGFRPLYAPITDAGPNIGHNAGTRAAASALAGQDETQWDLLASSVPALSFAAAANPITTLDSLAGAGGVQRNYNMQGLRRAVNGWPASRQSDWGNRWLHSDFRNMALPYVVDTYDAMLDIGGFAD